MKSHIAILAGGKPMTLPQDFSISVEMNNPLFHDSDLFSYPVELPVEGNRHVLKDVDDVAADMRPIDLEHTPMQIYLEGMPFASGPAVVQENERTDGKVSVSIDAGTRSFSDLISDMQCNEVPIPARYRPSLLIGEKIDEVNVQVKYATSVTIKYNGKKGDKKHASVGSYDTSGTFHPQALGFSFPDDTDSWGKFFSLAYMFTTLALICAPVILEWVMMLATPRSPTLTVSEASITPPEGTILLESGLGKRGSVTTCERSITF